MKRSEIIGAWAYQNWRIRYADGRVTEPFGAGATGLLLYTADGHMSACIMAGQRATFRHGNPRAASVRERALAFDGYFSYAGCWQIVEKAIVHEVTVALNPALVGTRQWRNARLRGRRLVLSADEQTAEGLRRHELAWRRVDPYKGSKPRK